MTRRLRLGLRAALVAALTTTMTVSPVSAGWLLNRLGGNSNGCCVIARPVQPCTPPPCCPPPTCYVAPPQPVCCGEIYVDGSGMVSGEVIYDESAPVDQQPPMPSEVEAPPAPGDEVMPRQPSQQEASPSDATEEAPAEELDADDESEAVPPPPIAPSPFDQPQPAPAQPQPAPAQPQPAPAQPQPSPAQPQPAPAQPAEVPAEQPEAAEEEDVFDFGAPAEEPSEELETPTEDDLFGDDFGTPDDELPPAADAPADDEAGDGLFEGFDTPPADDAADPPADDEAGDDIFDALGEPAADAPAAEEAGDDLFNGLLDDADEPVSTESPESPESPESAPADSDSSAIFDDLFGQTAPAAPVLTVTVAATKQVATSMEATESRLWIDNTGHFSTEGRLIAITDTHIRLLKSNGRTCTVEMRRLSPSDAAYVAAVARQVIDDADLLAAAK